jgi:hypothetical protein
MISSPPYMALRPFLPGYHFYAVPGLFVTWSEWGGRGFYYRVFKKNENMPSQLLEFETQKPS